MGTAPVRAALSALGLIIVLSCAVCGAHPTESPVASASVVPPSALAEDTVDSIESNGIAAVLALGFGFTSFCVFAYRRIR